MTFTTEQKDQLSAPLNRSSVKERKMAGRQMSYIEGWHCIAEANRIFGFDGWNRETVLLQETNRDLVDLESDRGTYQQWRISYVAKVRITVGNIVREGTGYGSGMGKPGAIGDAVEGAIKEAETDAMKRALMTFGNQFGLALYDKEQSEVVDDTKPVPKPQGDKHPSAPLYAPVDNAAEDRKAASRKWALGEIPRIKTMDRMTHDKFSERFKKAREELKVLDPKTSVELEKALADRLEVLFA